MVKNFLRFAWRKIVPSMIRNFLFDIRTPRFERKSFGNKNPNKKFLILGKGFSMDMGLFAIICGVVMNIRYCLEHNIILVVDLQNNDNQYLDGLGIGKENSWEYFFEQPFGYNLEQIKDCKNILFSKRIRLFNPFFYIFYSKFKSFEIFSFDKNLALLQDLKNDFKQYIRFNETVKNYVNSEYERIFKGKERVLGVLARGTDYLLKKPKYHRVQPEPNLILEKSKQTMHNCKCDYVYLATEDENIYKLFKDNFGDKLLVNSQKRIDLNKINLGEDELLHSVDFGRKRDKYNLALEYLSSLYNLSKCQCFVGGVTAGTAGIFLMTEGFEYQYLFDLGYYP